MHGLTTEFLSDKPKFREIVAEFLDYVQVLAAQAAVAIHNAQRYEEQSRRSEALRRWHGSNVVDELAAKGILIRSPSFRGVAEEAPLAYKDVGEVVDAADHAGLASKVARLRPLVGVKG